MIYLIGMPGCGKTTLGYLAAREHTFADLDALIEKQEGKSVAALFAMGEAAFREAETKALFSLSKNTPLLVATGGGTVLCPANVQRMRETGKIIWIDTQPEIILKRCALLDRPLISGDAERFWTLFKERQEQYRKAADVKMENNGSVAEGVQKLRRLMA